MKKEILLLSTVASKDTWWAFSQLVIISKERAQIIAGGAICSTIEEYTNVLHVLHAWRRVNWR